jgi:hypothetical protein
LPKKPTMHTRWLARISTGVVMSREIHNWTKLRGAWVRDTRTQVLIVR